MNQNLRLLADLLDVFAAAQDLYLTEHARDCNSDACGVAYARREGALEALMDEWQEVVWDNPRILSAALRLSK